jgi:hypothetical protein
MMRVSSSVGPPSVVGELGGGMCIMYVLSIARISGDEW